MQFFQIRQSVSGNAPVNICPMADFLRHQGTDSGNACVDRFGSGKRSGKNLLTEGGFCKFKGIFLFLRCGNKVCSAGKNFSHRAHVGRYVFDTVQNLIVFIAEDNIAVFSHNLHNQIFCAEIAQFVQVFYSKTNDSFHSRLGDGDDPPAANMLSQQHTEIRRSQRAVFVFVCQVSQRKAGVDR